MRRVKSNRPVGVLASLDLRGQQVLAACRLVGLAVPDDVAVIGFDDLGVAERTSPPLTTMRNPTQEMAERATRLLLEQIDGDRAGRPMRVVIQPQLVRRESA